MQEKIARVLLVEDDEDDYILTSDSLQQLHSHKFEIDWVTSPNQALEQLKRNVHDICLLDYQLGAYNGLTVLEKASQQGNLIPIIMLTGQSDDELDQSALAAGAVDYLVKSDISTSRFARAIRYALARQEIEKERFERINAETKNRSKDRFLAHLSHELRTPLTSILGYAEILLSNEKGALAQSELSIILNNGRHLLGLLNNVLDLSKIAVGKLELNYADVKLGPFIADLFSLMNVHAGDKGIQLKLDCEKPLPHVVRIDPVRLRQILINLIYNAIKFTDAGHVSLKIYTDNIQGNEMLCFDVVDTGAGIPADMLKTIFKPFEQVEDIVSRNQEGAGLGLAICSELIKRMSGAISVESTVNCGSNFSFNIDPGDISNQVRKTLAFDQLTESDKQHNLSQLTGRVLVVDDMDDIRMLVGHLCHSFGLDVSYASNGLEAIEQQQLAQSQAKPFDIILMDIHMPKLDGRRAIIELRKQGFTNPIFAITAAVMKGVRQELKSIGFDDIIDKPIDKSDLYSSLLAHLQRVSASAKNEQSSRHSSEHKLGIDKVKTTRVLVVEDDKDAADVTKLLLESLGIVVETADSAAASIQILQSHQDFDKILLDLHLPDVNGIELASQVKSLQPDAELILVSGAQVSKTILQSVGISRAILKPVNLTILKTLIES